MNTGDFSSGDESSQSYNSDSSSIPSFISDFEVDPSDDPPFAPQQNALDRGFSLLLTCDRKSLLPPNANDGSIMPPVSDRATPLTTCTTGHLHSGAGASLYTSAAPCPSSLYPHSSDIESVPPPGDLLLAVAPSYQLFTASDEQIPHSESSQSTAFMKSLTQPAKIHSPFPSCFSSLISPPVSSVHDRSYFVEGVASPSNKAENSSPLERNNTMIVLSENAEHSSLNQIRLEKNQVDTKMSSVSYRDTAPKRDDYKLSSNDAKLSTGSYECLSRLAVATGGYISTEEDVCDVRQPNRTQQPCGLHSQIAFPVQPAPEHAESLMRQMDNLNLPNVSPDSGIQSVESSPSGNDSPGSVTSVVMTEHAHDHSGSVLPGHCQAKQSTDTKFSEPLMQETLTQSSSDIVYQSGLSSELVVGIKNSRIVSSDSNATTENLPGGFSHAPGNVITDTISLEDSFEKDLNTILTDETVLTISISKVLSSTAKFTKEKAKYKKGSFKNNVLMEVRHEANVTTDGSKNLENNSSNALNKEKSMDPSINVISFKSSDEVHKSDPSFDVFSLDSCVETESEPKGEKRASAKESIILNADGEDIVRSQSVTKQLASLVLPDSMHKDFCIRDLPNPLKGPSIGRKKRGRPAKRKKSQMLQHKQSTLYRELYSSDLASLQANYTERHSDNCSDAERNMKTVIALSDESPSEIVQTENSTCVGEEGAGRKDKEVTAVKVDSAICSELKCLSEHGISGHKALVTPNEKGLSLKAGKSVQRQKPLVRMKKVEAKKKIGKIDKGQKSINVEKEETDVIIDDRILQKRRRGRPKGSKNKSKLLNSANSSEGEMSQHTVSIEFLATELATELSPKYCDKVVSVEDSSVAVDVFQSPAELVKVRSTTLARKRASTSQKKTSHKTSSTLKRLAIKKRYALDTKGNISSKVNFSQSQKRGRGRPRKKPLPIIGDVALLVKTKAVADSELVSLIQSVQHSIESQFSAPDMEESNDFSVGSSDISAVESSLPYAKSSIHEKSADTRNINTLPEISIVRKVVSKYKKPKVHVMMRNTRRRKKKSKVQRPRPDFSASDVSIKEPVQGTSSFKDLSEQESVSSCSVMSMFGPSSAKPISFTQPYNSSKLLKQSRLQALGSTPQGGDASSDDDQEGSEGRKKKKKKKLLYFKSKHRNIVDPVFMSELQSLLSCMDSLTISEQAFIRVKPGEVPLPSIFKLTIIDVKKKKKDRLILDPLSFSDKLKKTKVLKDSKDREPPMPDLVKEKIKGVRKKSQSEDAAPPSLEIQVQRDQCLPPKKRHRLMYAAESTEEVTSASFDCCPEKRKMGRTRKTTDIASDKGEVTKAEGTDDSVDKSSCLAQERQSRPLLGCATKEKIDAALILPPRESTNLVLACPRHTHKSDSVTSCPECSLLTQSQPSRYPSKPVRQQPARTLSPNSRVPAKLSNTTQSHKSKSVANRTKKNGSKLDTVSPSLTVSVSTTSPKSRTKLIAASLPRSEVVISPLPKMTVLSAHFGKKLSQSRCSISDVSDSGAEDESVIRSVCSEFEPLPLEHCHKKLAEPGVNSNNQTCRKRHSNSACDLNNMQNSESGAVKQGLTGSNDSQPPRKRYQRVGLFSDFYKDEPKKRTVIMAKCPTTKTPGVRKEQTSTLMPPPIHFGKYFRVMERDFQLPYDIWWQYTHHALPEKEPPRPKFKTIRNNVYVDVKPNTKKFEPHPCNCKQPVNSDDQGCLDDCLNRVVFTECTPETCPCGHQCSNQRIQKQDWAPALERFLTKDRGFGVRTLKHIETNRIIMEYLGEVVSEQEFRRRMTEEYSQDSHHYCLNMDGRTVIDGYRMGNLTRFVNHSCEPNCEMQKWNVNGLYHMVLQTLRDIKPFEEITYDYNFHSFNMEAQQECHCGSSACRGVIGGKFQRIGGQVGQQHIMCSSRRASTTLPPPPIPPPPVGKGQAVAIPPPTSAITSITRVTKEKKLQPHQVDYNFSRMVSPSMKPMSQRERLYARRHAIFLVRNIDRARKDRRRDEPEKTEEQATLEKVPDLLCMKDIINDHRSVKTRLGALADEKPELLRLHKLAVIFDEVYNAVATCRDKDGLIMASTLMSLPSRRRYPDYYKIVTEPIDLTTIRNNIKRGHYSDIISFDADVQQLFKNVESYCGKRSEMGKIIAQLRNVYQSARAVAITRVEAITGEFAIPSAAPLEQNAAEDFETKVMPQLVGSESEDVIRCVCGIYREEGTMIQCENCLIWQHCECIKVNPSDAGKEDLKYKCELCDPRPVDREILDPSRKDDTEGPDGETVHYYLSLVRDNNLQVSQGDCVYLLKDYKRPSRSSLRQSLPLASSPDKMDIFRVEELFKNSKGEKFCAGNLYLRPHETFHEPKRKFFYNELFRFPLYETYPLEQVSGKCFIMDLNTFCKGKPKGFHDKDVYICEYRVDRTAHLFSKISKKFPINMKSFCFEKYPQRISPKRTYEPHEVPGEYLRRGGSTDKSSESCSRRGSTSCTASVIDSCMVEAKVDMADVKRVSEDKKEECMFHLEKDKKLAKKERLSFLILQMLMKHNNSDLPKIDLSYLFEETINKHPRKKPTPFY